MVVIPRRAAAVAALLVAGLLGACASAPTKETRISTRLEGLEFNSVASQYRTRPTVVKIFEYGDRPDTLLVSVDLYGNRTGWASFFKGLAPAYIAHIDKFLEWEALARERGDALTREIGRAPSPSGGTKADLLFSFHSGNERSHFLTITFCMSMTCATGSGLTLDVAGAKELRALLLRFDAGELKHIPVDQVYK